MSLLGLAVSLICVVALIACGYSGGPIYGAIFDLSLLLLCFILAFLCSTAFFTKRKLDSRYHWVTLVVLTVVGYPSYLGIGALRGYLFQDRSLVGVIIPFSTVISSILFLVVFALVSSIFRNEKKNLRTGFSTTKRVWSFLVLGVALYLIFVFAALSPSFGDAFPKARSDLAIDIIIQLLPAIITIVSIPFSVDSSRDNYEGLSRKEFNVLRSGLSFSFIQMVFTVIGLFGAYTVFAFADLRLAILFLDALAFVFACLFCASEIPLICQDERRIYSIIRKAYLRRLKRGASYVSGGPLEQDLLMKAISYIARTKGVKILVSSFQRNDNEVKKALLEDCLREQNSYFRTVSSENVASFTPSDALRFKSEIGVGFSNIADMCQSRSNVYILNFTNEVENSARFLAVSLNTLKKASDAMGFKNTTKKGVNSSLLFADFGWYGAKGNERTFQWAVLNNLFVPLAIKGETWPLIGLRDLSFPLTLFDEKSGYYGFYICIFLGFYMQHENEKISSIREKFRAFYESEGEGLNPIGSFKNLFREKLLNLSISERICLLGTMLDIYHSTSDDIYWVYLIERGHWLAEESDSFTDDIIIDFWVEMLLYIDTFDETTDTQVLLEKYIDSLKPEYKKLLIKRAEKKWISVSNGVRRGSNPVLLKALDLYHETIPNETIVRVIAERIGSFNTESIIEEVEKLKETKNVINDVMSDLIKSGLDKRRVSLVDDFKKTNDAAFDCGELACSCRINRRIGEPDANAKIVADYFLTALDRRITDMIRRLVKPERGEVKDYPLPYYILCGPIESGYGFVNQSLRLGQGADEILVKNALSMERRDWCFPDLLFWKNENSLLVKVTSETIVRTPTEREVDKIIEKDCPMVNGLYRYSDCTGDSVGACLMPLQSLRDVIAKSTYFAEVKFKIMILAKISEVKRYPVKGYDD